MNAISQPLTPSKEQPASPAPAREGNRARRAARALWREVLRSWLGPFLVIAALAVCHQAGLFTLIDGRFFDFVTANEPARAPKVVVIERDDAFAQDHKNRLTRLDAELTRLGVERIGYLGLSDHQVPTGSVPVIAGHRARLSPASGFWRLTQRSQRPDGPLATARAIAPSSYGINRTQFAELAGRRGPIPVFDVALAGQSPRQNEFLVRMSRRQNIPILTGAQVLSGEMRPGELAGTVALVSGPDALVGTLSTPLTPDRRATSEAMFRAHAIQSLRSGRTVAHARLWESWLLLFTFGAILALTYRRADPKRLAIIVPLALTALAIAGCWAALQLAGKLLPVTALLVACWAVTFERVLRREASQDRRLERSASRAVQVSFRRSPLREGARLPQFLGSAARYAGVEHSLLIERLPSGRLETVAAENASLDDIALGRKKLNKILDTVAHSSGMHDASEIVPQWGDEPRIGWVGSPEQQLFWLHARPESATPGKSAHLMRAITASFRELFRWRNQLNARSRQDERFLPVDDKVAGAIALIAHESEQIRAGFDTIDTAVVIFHLIGSPLHANRMMQDLFREAGLSLFDASLSEVLQNLTGFGAKRVDALVEDLMLNGGEMRLPMRDIGSNERILRLAAPTRNARSADRVMVLEAVDMADLNRAADLRQAVAQFIDLQLRNDFEAILLGAKLAGNERLPIDQIRSVVSQIGETARRATNRLDEVAELVRAENRDLVDTCYPIDAAKVVSDAATSAESLASELGVAIEKVLPGMSGFTIAEPNALSQMLVAMLRVVIADTPQDGTVALELEELDGRTMIRVSGGFGIGFGRLMWLMNNYEDEAVGEFRVIGEGMTKALQWGASVSYWGREADGFGFNIDLRRIG